MTLAGFLLLGFGLMASGHDLSFDWLTLKQNKPLLQNETLIFILLFCGFAIRMPLFPFHGWLPILAEQSAVASVAIFIVGLKLGIYATARFIPPSTLPDRPDSGLVADALIHYFRRASLRRYKSIFAAYWLFPSSAM